MSRRASSTAAQAAFLDRRGAVRHAPSAWLEVDGRPGHVVNLSTRGLYFTTPAPLEANALVEVGLTLSRAGAIEPLRWRVSARVLRIDRMDEGFGVAAEIESWRSADAAACGGGR